MTDDRIFGALALLRLADEPDDRREILDGFVVPVVEQVLDADDPEQIVRAGRMVAHVAGREQPVTWFVERLEASPPHARGYLLEALDDLAFVFANCPRPVRWA